MRKQINWQKKRLRLLSQVKSQFVGLMVNVKKFYAELGQKRTSMQMEILSWSNPRENTYLAGAYSQY